MTLPIVHIGGGSKDTCTVETVGAKAAFLSKMAALGLPVPPAFVLPVALCAGIVKGDPQARQALESGLEEGIAFLEKVMGRKFGDRRDPLLVSVRSGAARSMPGMLDTVLDVGCTPEATRGIMRETGNPRFAWDCRCRFLEGYADVVLGQKPAGLAAHRDALIAAEGAKNRAALDGEALERLASAYAGQIESDGGSVPDDPMDQLRAAAEAVYRSWMSDRAVTYRRIEHLESLAGTGVTVQAMVFGNRGLTSGAGVAFSRDPSTGAQTPVIDVLFESQGEDVVSGARTPENEAAMTRIVPEAAAELRRILRDLEHVFADVQDVEFTFEEGKLWILQTRSAKRTPRAALRFAVDFVKEKLITPQEGLTRVAALDPEALVTTRLEAGGAPVGKGTAASTGVAVGRAAFDSASAARMAADGTPVVLVRPDISTDDVAGFEASRGILTATGGRTAHAALVARQLGRPCVVGCAGLKVDVPGRRAVLNGKEIAEGDWLTIDGGTGDVYLGEGKVVTERPEAELAEVERWKSEVHA